MEDRVEPPQPHAGASSDGLAGSTAVIAGLKSRPELNGERVTVGQLQPNGRYEVRVRGESVSLRPGNLQRSTGAGATTSAPPALQELAREHLPAHAPPPRLLR